MLTSWKHPFGISETKLLLWKDMMYSETAKLSAKSDMILAQIFLSSMSS